MKKNNFHLTATDFLAIQNGEDNYLYNKGKLSRREEALEYYKIAAAMGNIEAIKELGRLYLCGLPEEWNIKLASAYFTIAANRGDVGALYMLGFINETEQLEIKNLERATYYYKKAIDIVLKDFTEKGVLFEEKLEEYPSLCLAIARALLDGKHIEKDLGLSFLFARRAFNGYKLNGAGYDTFVEKAEAFMNSKDFDGIRKKYNSMFNNRFYGGEYEEIEEFENNNIDDDIDFDDFDLDDTPF